MYISGDQIPKLNLPINLELYSLDYTNCEETLQLILAHPRDKVLEDLHRIIENSIVHQDTYINAPFENEITNEEHVATFPFVFHAVYLLGELKSENSLEYFFRILSQSDEYIDTFIGMDVAREGIWETIYRLANHQLDAFRPFLFRNDISFLRKSVFLDVAKQVYLHQPNRREEVKKWYISLLKDFLSQAEYDDQPDPDFTGNIIWDVLDMQIEEAAPLVRQAYENEMVSIHMCGPMEKVLGELGTADPAMEKRPVLASSKDTRSSIRKWKSLLKHSKTI